VASVLTNALVPIFDKAKGLLDGREHVDAGIAGYTAFAVVGKSGDGERE